MCRDRTVPPFCLRESIRTSVCVSLGVLGQEQSLSEGELMLYSKGGASIVLKNDGRVLINGREYGND